MIQRRGVPKSQSFAPTTYGLEEAGVLAHAWIHRMSFFCNMVCRSPWGQDLVIDQSLFALHAEPSELVQLSSTASGQLRDRVTKIRNFRAPRAEMQA